MTRAIYQLKVTLRRLAGRHSCPPEDCGRPWGYADLLEAPANPDHPQHQELREWVPLDFDPASFDIENTTERMRSPRPLKGCM